MARHQSTLASTLAHSLWSLERARQWSALTPSETFIVKEKLSELSAEISGIETRLTLEDSNESEALQAQRTMIALKERVSEYSSLLAPIRTLPPEILQEIFFLCDTSQSINYNDDIEGGCPESCSITCCEFYFYRGEFIFNYFLSLLAALKLLSVCATWSQIVRDTPGLWTQIEISFRIDNIHSHVPFEMMKRMKTALDFMLQRSKASMLDIKYGVAVHYAHTGAEYRSILDLIFAESHRWRSLELEDEVLSEDPIYEAITGHLPRLEYLSLMALDSPTGSDGINGPFLTFLKAPSLRHVVLYGPPVAVLGGIALPWSQIIEAYVEMTEFRQDFLTTSKALSVAKQLKVLSINWLHDWHDPRSYLPEPSFVELNVQVLRMDSFERVGLDYMVELFRFPHLTELVLSATYDCYLGDEDLSGLFILLPSVAGTLRSLTLFVADLSSETVTHILHAAPMLSSLALELYEPPEVLNVDGSFPIPSQAMTHSESMTCALSARLRKWSNTAAPDYRVPFSELVDLINPSCLLEKMDRTRRIDRQAISFEVPYLISEDDREYGRIFCVSYKATIRIKHQGGTVILSC